MPIIIQRLRSGTPRVAAMTMPTMRPASMTSRKTMINAPSMTYSAMITPLAVASLIFADRRDSVRVLAGQCAPRPLIFRGSPSPPSWTVLSNSSGVASSLTTVIDYALIGRHLELGWSETVVLDCEGHSHRHAAPEPRRSADQPVPIATKNISHPIPLSKERPHKSIKRP